MTKNDLGIFFFQAMTLQLYFYMNFNLFLSVDRGLNHESNICDSQNLECELMPERTADKKSRGDPNQKVLCPSYSIAYANWTATWFTWTSIHHWISNCIDDLIICCRWLSTQYLTVNRLRIELIHSLVIIIISNDK